MKASASRRVGACTAIDGALHGDEYYVTFVPSESSHSTQAQVAGAQAFSAKREWPTRLASRALRAHHEPEYVCWQGGASALAGQGWQAVARS